jgi:RNA polymerase sigma factor (TIGR02999 family)
MTALELRPSPEDQVPAKSEEITLLLQQWRGGDRDAESKLFRVLMPELRKIADRALRRERRGHTLQRTELVNEIFLKLEKAKTIDWQDRGHFFAIVTRMMRRYLIDYARSRPKPELLSMEGLPEGLMAGKTRLEVALAVDELLDELEKEFPRRCNVVVLISYLGLTPGEAAEKLGLSERTVEREWHEGKKWLFERLSGEPCKTASKTTSV